jgi:hypothetical protein
MGDSTMTTKAWIDDTPAKIITLRGLLVAAAPKGSTHTKTETRNFAALTVQSLEWLCACDEASYNQLLGRLIKALER